MLKQSLLVATIGIALISLTGCGDSPTSPANNSPLVGTWKMTTQTTTDASGSQNTISASEAFGNTYVFGKDYSLNVDVVLLGMSVSLSGTWSATADTVTLTIEGEPSKWNYEIAGSELTLTQSTEDEEGITTTVEKYAKQ